MPHRAEGGLDDQLLSTAIYQAIKIPLAGGHYNVHRDNQSNLAFNVFTINGGREVTFLEEKGIVRVAHRANGLFDYLSSMHTLTRGATTSLQPSLPGDTSMRSPHGRSCL